jgi:hypothetical protein
MKRSEKASQWPGDQKPDFLSKKLSECAPEAPDNLESTKVKVALLKAVPQCVKVAGNAEEGRKLPNGRQRTETKLLVSGKRAVNSGNRQMSE